MPVTHVGPMFQLSFLTDHCTRDCPSLQWVVELLARDADDSVVEAYMDSFASQIPNAVFDEYDTGYTIEWELLDELGVGQQGVHEASRFRLRFCHLGASSCLSGSVCWNNWLAPHV